MSKRNLISEIQNKNARASERHLHGLMELFELERSVRLLDSSEPTLFSLLIMGIASCIEVSTREAIKRLIDSNETYLERAESFKEHIRFDFSLTKALSTGKITFGDLVSHSIPVSKIDHIASHIELLFNSKNESRKFDKILSDICIYVEPEEDELFGNTLPGHVKKQAPPLLEDTVGLLKNIAWIFETRHLVAHEASFDVVTIQALSNAVSNARLFVNALYELVEQALNPGASRNAPGLSLQTLMKAGEIRLKTYEIQERIHSKITSGWTAPQGLLKLFSETIEIFNAYNELESEFRLSLHGMVTGPSMHNIESNVVSQLWSHRLAYLTNVESDVDFYAKNNSDT